MSWGCWASVVLGSYVGSMSNLVVVIVFADGLALSVAPFTNIV